MGYKLFNYIAGSGDVGDWIPSPALISAYTNTVSAGSSSNTVTS